MIRASLAIGYHGCARQLAEAVVLGKTPLQASRNSHDWLGHGIYFWQDDPKRAAIWADKSMRESSEPAVLGAIIDLGNCLNTSQVVCGELLTEAFAELTQSFEEYGIALPKNRGRGWANRQLDCAVFEHLHELRARKNQQSYDTVVGYFPEGGSIYPGAAVRQFDHVQICVRNEAKILGYFLPR